MTQHELKMSLHDILSRYQRLKSFEIDQNEPINNFPEWLHNNMTEVIEKHHPDFKKNSVDQFLHDVVSSFNPKNNQL